MDLETMRLLTEHVDDHETTVGLVISQIAAALAAQPALALAPLRADLMDRAERFPDTRPCLEKLLIELDQLRAVRGRLHGELSM